LFAVTVLETQLDRGRFTSIDIDVPACTILTTQMFDLFMDRNDLWGVALSNTADDRIALAFQQADLPVEFVGDLRGLVEQVHSPLAVRSSSLLEDAMFRPFAGVYETKMIPNNQSDASTRFAKLVEAIKFVYASMFTRSAKNYLKASGKAPRDEKMAVVIQEVVGRRHGDRYYPDVAGVAKSYNFYPTGRARPEEGVVSLALGLGKSIVDGGVSWTYSPAHPRAPSPFASAHDLLENTQLQFWAVNMGPPPAYDPIAETEYLMQLDLAAAEYDDTLRYVASTYDPQSDRLVIGTGASGPRALTFAPMLDLGEMALNDVVRALLDLFSAALAAPVEIEFACTIDRGPRMRVGFLQVRPMVVSEEVIDIEADALRAPGLLLASDSVMGNGASDGIRDIVYVKPGCFDKRATREIAAEVEQFNATLLDAGAPYLLIGFGRWGSADPFLGIPVRWGQICGAQAIVEATLPEMNVDPSQGSHFFHNMSSFRAYYFAVHHESDGIAWEWLGRQPRVAETTHVRHVRVARPLRIRVDGRSRRGGVWFDTGSAAAAR
jgi:pyruvate phosphate dikinase-like enzyme